MAIIKELLMQIHVSASKGMADYDYRFQALLDITRYAEQLYNAFDTEERIEYVVERKDEINEARGAAIAAINKYKRSLLTPEEAKALVEKDLADLFGDDERGKE